MIATSNKQQATSNKQQATSNKQQALNVLSLCDGMSCGQIALERAGIKVNNYLK